MKNPTEGFNPIPEENKGETNFHEIHSERKALRQILKDKESLPERISEPVKRRLEEVEKTAKEFKIRKEKVKGKEEILRLREAIEKIKPSKERAEGNLYVNESSIIEEIGEDYKTAKYLDEEREDLRDFEMKMRLNIQRDPQARKTYEGILATTLTEKDRVTKKEADLAEKNSTAVRAHELVSYKLGLQKEGHIAPTESVRENLDEIGKKMITGKPMFLHGPTGTGKTSLARFSAEHFTGNKPEMVYCNPQTRESSVWGKTGIRPSKDGGGAIETIDIFGPLAKAMNEGKTVIFDEFTALPREQMVFIKGVFNAKPGDQINVVGNGQIKIKPGFQMIFTANLKSEKNPERQELPPEIAREFEQNNLKINYTPKEEAYDIMLARLMNPDGSIDLSYKDINETLPKFCEAMEEVQIAYTGITREETAKLIGEQGVGVKTPSLKKMVFTQGTVEAILSGWQLEKQDGRKSFAEYLDSRLKTALTFEEYSEADRKLAAKILASKGFLLTLDPEDLNLPKNIFDFNVAKKLRGEDAKEELITESNDVKHIRIKELTELDPFGKRPKKAIEEAEEFLQTPEKSDGKKFLAQFDKELKGMRKTLKNQKEALGVKEDFTIKAEYVHKDEKGKEITENIEIDIEKKLEQALSFYKSHNIDIPEDFEEIIKDVWERNIDDMKEAMEKFGFDEALIVPANIKLDDAFDKEMTGGYKKKDGSKGEPTVWYVSKKDISSDTRSSKNRIILVHKNKAKDLYDTPETLPILKETLGKKFGAFKPEEGLTIEEYFIFQRQYFEETGKHLDEKGWTWLRASTTGGGSRVVGSFWDPDFGQVGVSADDAGNSDGSLGCRLSRSFK